MKVTISKSVLEEFLSTISENYVPGDDDIDKFAIEDEPIKAVEMMSTQLAREKPDVGDPDYMPGSVPSLSDAASVIASEVPPDPEMIAKFYQGMHFLLDKVYDIKQDKEMLGESRGVLNESNEDPIAQIAQGVVDYKTENALEISELEQASLSMGQSLNDAALIQHVLDQRPDLKAIARSATRKLRMRPQALMAAIAQKFKELDVATQKFDEADYAMVAGDVADTTFSAILSRAGAPLIANARETTTTQLADIEEMVEETIAGLSKKPTISMQGYELESKDVINLLRQDFEDYKSRAQMPTTAQSVAVADQLPKPIEDPKVAKKTYTALKEFLGFSGESGVRQWYRKHVENKFLSLLKTMLDPEAADPGSRAFYDSFSNSYKSIVKSMINSIDGFKSQYAIQPGSLPEQAMNSLISDLNALNTRIDSDENILNLTGDYADMDDPIIDVMSTNVGNAVAQANADVMKVLTTFIMDKASPKLIYDVILASHPSLPQIVERNNQEISQKKRKGKVKDLNQTLKGLQEHISGKSNRAFTDKEEQSQKYTATTNKFLDLDIDYNLYHDIVSLYLTELDKLLEAVLIPPDKVDQATKQKFSEVISSDKEISSIYNKMTKKSQLKQEDIFSMLEEALAQYLTDLKMSSSGSIQEQRKRDLRLLSEIISKCL